MNLVPFHFVSSVLTSRSHWQVVRGVLSHQGKHNPVFLQDLYSLLENARVKREQSKCLVLNKELTESKPKRYDNATCFA
jgi:hypothetical protein